MRGDRHLRTENEPAGLAIYYLLGKKPAKKVEIVISDEDGDEVARLEGTTDQGLNRVQWDTGDSEDEILPGDYTVTLIAGRKRQTRPATLEPPRAFAIGPASGPMIEDRPR